MEKARLTREQAEALEYARRIVGGEAMDVIETHVQEAWNDDKCRPLNPLTTDHVCRALYIGYEIIEEDQVVTVTEHVRELLRSTRGEFDFDMLYSNEDADTYKQGFDAALNTLGIKL